MRATFSIQHHPDGRCHYELQTASGDTVLAGPIYPSERACKRGIFALQRLVAAAAVPASETPHHLVGSDTASSA